MSNEMIERVALALIDADPSVEGYHESHIEAKRKYARAAIAAHIAALNEAGFVIVPREPINEAKENLWSVCRLFVAKQRIRCSETIYQTDRVIENAYEFIEAICSIVGYLAPEREDHE